MLNSWSYFNANDLSVEMCISELVKISLKRKASSIAVRFNPKTRKIQVVDNGIGFTKYELLRICSEVSKDHNDQKEIFNKIGCISNVTIITSREEFSSHTYVKILRECKMLKLFEGYHRPSKGTTVSIYDFNPSKWDDKSDKNCSISYVIAAIAFAELSVSFSLRNDDQNKIILNINKPHNPWDIVKFLKGNETYEENFQLISQMIAQTIIDQNINEIDSKEDSIAHCPCVISDLTINDSTNINDNMIISPFSEWSNWSYKPCITDINKNASGYSNEFDCNLKQINIFNDNFINLSQMSIWSDWSYNPKKPDTNNGVKDPHYKFLPISNNILNDPHLNEGIKEMFNCYQNVSNMKICNMKRKLAECRISGNTIHSLQILKQVNKEFIVAITNENGKKLLIVIDQHAVHERIRYEWLIETYREKESYKFFSVKLNKELLISDMDQNLLELIILHKKILTRVGINIKSIINPTSCIVDTVPKCFIKKVKSYNYESHMYRLIKNVRKLLLEIADGLSISASVLPPLLPITINNVIASEACHEAIKFGDPLSVKDCTMLIQALQDTKAPTRCAHGRPSIVPIMDLSEVEKRKSSKLKKKLNFGSLKTNIKKK